MLKAIWDKAVYGYQTVLQDIDRSQVETLEAKMEEARNGYVTYVSVSPVMHSAHVGRISLSPEEAERYIAEREKARTQVLETMAQRREKYGLKI
ncbi:MAG: hypothetical protein KJ667_08460 [Alphaproteobacteria bacterium]|nr:hypothetical protein [Alphaproteobacteria bacterium]